MSLMMGIEGVENTKEILSMEVVVGETMARMILISPVHVAEGFQLVIEGPFQAILSAVNVQGRTPIFLSGH